MRSQIAAAAISPVNSAMKLIVTVDLFKGVGLMRISFREVSRHITKTEIREEITVEAAKP